MMMLWRRILGIQFTSDQSDKNIDLNSNLTQSIITHQLYIFKLNTYDLFAKAQLLYDLMKVKTKTKYKK